MDCTDLRNDLYQRILKRSTSFFSRYPTGKLVSTVISDVEEEFKMRSPRWLAEFLQQFFTLIFYGPLVVIALGGKLALGAFDFNPSYFLGGENWAARAPHNPQRQDKLSDIQNILHETITGNAS